MSLTCAGGKRACLTMAGKEFFFGPIAEMLFARVFPPIVYVRVCAEKNLAHLTLRKLRDPARIATKHDWPPGRSQSLPGSSSSELKITTDHEMSRT